LPGCRFRKAGIFLTMLPPPSTLQANTQAALQQAKQLAENFKRKRRSREWRPFAYQDLGTMGTIGRNRAVVDLPRLRFQGFFAWLIWLFVHLFQILGVKNKLFIFLNWVWNYFTYDQSLRLIIRPKQRALEESGSG